MRPLLGHSSLSPVSLPCHSPSTCLTFDPNLLPPSPPVPASGPRKSPAVGNSRFYDALEGFPPGDGLQRKESFFKGKVVTPSSLCMPPLFLTRPQSTLTLCIHSVHRRPAEKTCTWTARVQQAGFWVCLGAARLGAPSSPLPPVVRARVDMTECTDCSSETQVKTLQISRPHGFCGAVKKQLGLGWGLCPASVKSGHTFKGAITWMWMR